MFEADSIGSDQYEGLCRFGVILIGSARSKRIWRFGEDLIGSA